jgi:hypothetical protein
MALDQVGARTAGDVYQGLFFWKQAADLLRPDSMVDRVVLEHDEAGGVDDVAVFYREPGVDAGGWMVRADYFQLKYHVDNRDCYSSDALIDPSFVKAKHSLLERFYSAYTCLVKDHAQFRLHLVSNWSWQPDDKLGELLREYDGALPRRFFEDGPRSRFGKIREQWKAHLDLDSEEFAAFAKTLRIELDHFGRRHFRDLVYRTLEAAGLQTPSADRAASPYESLTQQFLMSGRNCFDSETLRDLCEREGLLAESAQNDPRPVSIGVRSFVRFAERLDTEVDELVCVSSNFEGRHPSTDASWDDSARDVLAFLGDLDRRAQLRTAEAVVALECHGSLALLAGWELSRNSGTKVAPIQKPSRDVWRPGECPTVDATWVVNTVQKDNDVDDVAVCLSVTHDVDTDVEEYLSSADAPSVSRVVVLSPQGGPSSQRIEGADHAYQLAGQLPGLLAKARPNRRALVHVFFACPNALMFFIGQQREALGPLAVYEFDFGLEQDGSYQRSLSLPISASTVNETHGVPDDSEV